MRIVVFLSGLLFVWCCQLSAQTIVNVERLLYQKDSTVTSLILGYNGTRGNVHTDAINISPSVVFVRQKHDTKLFGDYAFLSKSGQAIFNSGYIHARFNYKFNRRLKTFTFIQAQFNEVLLMNKRGVAGAGIRMGLLKSDSIRFNIGVGAMYEYEELNNNTLLPEEVYITNFIRGAMVSGFSWIINNNLRLDNVLYYQPRFADMEDFRLLNDINLSFKVNSNISFMVSNTMRYDSKPPSTLKNFDNQLNIKLAMDF